MSFRNNAKECSANFVTIECKACNVLIGYADIEWIDGLPIMFCIKCFKQKGYPINEIIWVANEQQINRTDEQPKLENADN